VSNTQTKIKKTLNRLTRRQLLELDTCSHCALCTESCPAYHESNNVLYAPGARAFMLLRLYNKKNSLWARIFGEKEITQKEAEELAESTYHCTLCSRCMESCPFGFQTHELWIRAREIVDSMETAPENVTRMAGLMDETMNPYGLEPDTRLDWSLFTDLDDVPELDEAEIAYFVGCTTAYKGANHEIAFAICSLLENQGENWTLLGEDEWCCGAPSLMAGKYDEAKKYALHNVEALESKKVKKVITGCAGCYRMLKFEYPRIIGRKPNFEVVHVVQYLNDQISSGKLKVEKGSEKIIYHHPCELGRLGGVIEEPRRVLASLSSNVVEFEDHGVDSKCCGGGGLLQSVDNKMRLNIVKEKLDEAVEKKAEMLVSACPACKLAFTDGVREFKHDIEILDITELIARHLGVLE